MCRVHACGGFTDRVIETRRRGRAGRAEDQALDTVRMGRREERDESGSPRVTKQRHLP